MGTVTRWAGRGAVVEFLYKSHSVSALGPFKELIGRVSGRHPIRIGMTGGAGLRNLTWMNWTSRIGHGVDGMGTVAIAAGWSLEVPVQEETPPMLTDEVFVSRYRLQGVLPHARDVPVA